MNLGKLEIWPAIDLLGGRAVRLRQGRPESAWTVSEDPVGLAQTWTAQGCRRLHVVDLDAAFGTGANREVVQTICASVHVPVQVGGGVRDERGYWQLRELGASRVVVGSLAVTAPHKVATLAQQDPGSLVVAGDVKGGEVRLGGWQGRSGESLSQFATRMKELGVVRLLVTGIERDGTRKGPDLELLRQALGSFGAGVVASGGVGNWEHLAKLKALVPLGLEGVVVGAAVAGGQLSLGELLTAEGD